MSVPQVITTVAEMQGVSLESRRTGVVGLVPTMGALHEGHLSLVKAAKQQCGTVVASIFVNPTQFGPSEDFQRYPRTFEADLDLLRQADVQYVFAPGAEEMYPNGAETFVDVGALGEQLDGSFRLGHFRGVATVVSKLFHITLPHFAFFGQKDAAQVAVLRAMVRDLNFPLEIVVCPTIREADGLAMSSRNRYLKTDERAQALILHKALRRAEREAAAGTVSGRSLREVMAEELRLAHQVAVEYVEVVSPETLLPVENVEKGALLAIAAKVGSTRLIDNILLPPMREGAFA